MSANRAIMVLVFGELVAIWGASHSNIVFFAGVICALIGAATIPICEGKCKV